MRCLALGYAMLFAMSPSIASALWGHYWTIVPFLSRFPRSPALPPAEPWSLDVSDDRLGSVRLSGAIFRPPGAERLILAIHGLGGSSGSTYLIDAVAEAWRRGTACLCLNLRGADGRGEDFYHAALTSDLHAAFASPSIREFRSIHLLGFSLGGHLVLRLATEAHDQRVRSVAAICAPLDLERAQVAIDQAGRAVYRHYVLRRLKASYAAVARRRPVPTPLERVLGVRTIRQWDQLTVVPRFGFESPGEYYRCASVASRLPSLQKPALLVETEHDPMVPASTVRPALAVAPAELDVRWLARGGHVGFPADIDLGEEGPRGLAPQVLSWLVRTNADSA